jgi:hypothetical protein
MAYTLLYIISLYDLEYMRVNQRLHLVSFQMELPMTHVYEHVQARIQIYESLRVDTDHA